MGGCSGAVQLLHQATMGMMRAQTVLLLINRAAMGRARFLIYPWFILFFFCHVGELNQTSLGQNSYDATYVVY